jgi:glycerol-3-phosphate dehydrogenase
MEVKINNTTFSAFNRQRDIGLLENQSFDLLVIGGGITGAGIALDAASRGLKVALIEKKDYAWGTSSRSTKLIHGGLRYLKQFEFKLVHEVGTERAIVHRNARHIVIPEKMLLPIQKGGSLTRNMSAWALWVYDWLAGVEKNERKKMLSAAETMAAEPLLNNENLIAGGLYYEYRTDDARLTIEVIKSAVELGAVCLNYAEVSGFTYNKAGKINNVHVLDKLENQHFTVKVRTVVNAAGPWVDSIRKLDKDGVKGKRLQLSKGVHLVIPREKLALQQSVYFDVLSDKRMVFAIPRGKVTYLGTTDTIYNDAVDSPHTDKKDVLYILDAVNKMFPEADIKMEDVISSWAGLRPLIYAEGKSVSELSRKDEIFRSRSGLLSIAGGKLTGYRKMAEKVVNEVCKTISVKTGCKTKNLKLSGADFENNADFEKFITLRIGQCRQIMANPEEIRNLAYRYGANLDLIIEEAFNLYQKTADPVERLLCAEIWYTIHYEQVSTLSDFIIRRTGRLYFERDRLSENYHFIANQMAALLNWTPAKLEENISEFEKSYFEVVNFRME